MDQSKFNEKNTANEVLAIDLFCGCGGVTEGLKQAGFTVIAAVDNDPICCQTYRLNHPEVSLLEKDICKTSARSLKSILGKRKLDLLVVCAPCQPFSSLNKSKKPDERVYLILQSVRFTKALKPKYVLFENVPGITKNSTVINQLKSEFSKLGCSSNFHDTSSKRIRVASRFHPNLNQSAFSFAKKESWNRTPDGIR